MFSGSDGKVSAYKAGDFGSIPGLGRSPGEGNVFLPGKSHGQRSLVGYSPWDCKESDMTERLHFICLWVFQISSFVKGPIQILF